MGRRLIFPLSYSLSILFSLSFAFCILGTLVHRTQRIRFYVWSASTSPITSPGACPVYPANLTYIMLKCLTFYMYFGYKYFMQQTNEIKTSLKREYDLYSNAMVFYKKTLKEFEQKHRLSTQVFLKRFESGQLGDEADYFDWYAFAKLLAKWRKAQSIIRSAIQ